MDRISDILNEEKTPLKQLMLNLGIFVGSFLFSLVLEAILDFFATIWGYDLNISQLGESIEIFYYLGKQFQLFAIIITSILLISILFAFFKNIQQDNFANFSRSVIPWFFIFSGLVLGFAFFFPEGMGLTHSREFYWRAALPFAIIGGGLSIQTMFEMVKSYQKTKLFIGWLGISGLLALGIFTILHQDANHPWMLSLSLGMHYLITFWGVVVSLIVIGTKIIRYTSWKDLLFIVACINSLILFIIASPPLIPRGTDYLTLYSYFSVILIVGATSLLLWAINEVCSQLSERIEN
ncbi:MAG: hypothetical protein ACFFC7_01530 [Candidatus Hermodarchaeota archaeon]